MTQPPKITWKEMTIPRKTLVRTLNALNFQPGKFYLLPDLHSIHYVTVLYVDKETP